MGIGEHIGCNVGENVGISGSNIEDSALILNPPTNFAIGIPRVYSMPVTWTAPVQDDAIEYQVKDSSDDSTVAIVPFPAVSTTVSGLNPEQSYTFYVVTSDGTGNISLASNTDTATTQSALSGIIFEQSFIGIPDMDLTGRYLYLNDPNDDASFPRSDTVEPGSEYGDSGFDFQYLAEMNTTNPPAQINNGTLEVWDESGGDANSWAWHDYQLIKFLWDIQLPEMWLRFDILFNPNLDTTNFNAAKIARMGHYNQKVADGTTGTAIINTENAANVAPYGNTTAGLVFWDLKSGYNKYQFRGNPTYQRDGKIHTYVSDEDGRLPSQDYADTYGDGLWHKIEMRCVMNSSPGAKDGLFEMYMDGILQTKDSENWSNNLEHADETNMDLDTIDWIDGTLVDQQPAVTGFNCFTLGGNADFNWDGVADDPNAPEQWFYSFKNVIVTPSRHTDTAKYINQDHNYKQWLSNYIDSKLLVGAGDPEGFLYLGSKQADGTRSGGSQQAIINAIAANGSNLLYMQSVRNPGDGNADETPWPNNDPANGLDADIMAQWEGWFNQLEAVGVYILFFLWDDHNSAIPVFGDGDTCPADEVTFITNLVNEFKHHKNFIWMLGEEYDEAFTAARASAQAEVMRAASPDIIIGNHQLNGTVFDFKTDANIRFFGIQQNSVSASAMNTALAGINGDAVTNGYCYGMIETTPVISGTAARQMDWACFMAGSCVIARLGMDPSTAAISDLQDCQRLIDFTETTSFNKLLPNNTLASSGTDYVLAGDKDYIAYAVSLSGDIGITGMTAGTYDLLWQSCDADEQQWVTDVVVTTGTNAFTKPAAINTECAVWLRRQ